MSDEPERHDISELIEARHHRAEIVFGVASFGLAVVLLTRLGAETTWIDGQPLSRQPMLWPAVSIGLMLVFGAFELLFSWRRNASGRGESIAGEVFDWFRAIEYAAWFMAYVFAVPLAGYLPVTIVFCIALAWRLGYRTGRSLVAAVLVAIAIVVVFKSLLSVKIPGGAVYEYLPDGLRNIMILYF